MKIKHIEQDSWETTYREVLSLDPAHHRLQLTLRMIYTQVALYRLRGGSYQNTDHDLQQRLYTALSAAAEVGVPLDLDLDQTTLNTRTAMSRIGLNVNEEIQRFIACPSCWTLVDYNSLYSLDDVGCQAMKRGRGRRIIRCSSPLFEQNGTIRTPFKVLPIYKFSRALRTLLQDPQVRLHLQDWRTVQEREHIDSENDIPYNDLAPFVGRSTPMRKFSDGAAWRTSPAHVSREFDGEGKVVEVVKGPRVFAHSNLRFGLKIALNMDW